MAIDDPQPFGGFFPFTDTIRDPEDKARKEKLLRLANAFSRSQRRQSAGQKIEIPTETAIGETTSGLSNLEQAGAFGPAGAASAQFGVFRLLDSSLRAVRGLGRDLGLDIGPEEEIEREGAFGQGPAEGASDYDVTDPEVAVDPQFLRENPGVQRLRVARRFTDGLARASFIEPLIGGGAFTPQGAIAQGEMTPPETPEGQIASLGGELAGSFAPALAAFFPFRAGTRALTATTTGQRLTGALGGSRPVQALARRFGREGVEEASEAALRRAGQDFAEEVIGEAGGEIGSGFALEGFYNLRSQLETEGEVDFGELAKMGGIGAGVGTVLGAGIRLGDIRDVTSAAKALDDLVSRGDFEIPMGATINGKKKTPNGWRDIETNQFASSPSSDEIQPVLVEQAARAMGANENQATRIAADAEEEARERATKEVSENLGETTDEIIDRTQLAQPGERRRFVEDATRIALRYRTTASSIWNDLTAQLEETPAVAEAYQRMIRELRQYARSGDPDIDVASRKTAMGRAMAMEQHAPFKEAVGEDVVPSSPAQLQFVNAAKRMAQIADDEIFQERINVLSGRRDEDPTGFELARTAQRIRQDGEVSQNQQAVRNLVKDAEAQKNRGVTEGTEVVLEDGTVGEVLGEPQWGVARVKRADDTVVTASIRDLELHPEAGSTVQLQSGPAKVAAVDASEKIARVELPDGQEAMIGLDEVESVAKSGGVKSRTSEAFEDAGKMTDEGTQPLPEEAQIEGVLKETGESVRITRISEDKVTYIDQNGEEVTTALDNVGIGSRTVPETADESADGVIRVFEPGTTPSAEGRNINFLNLPEAKATAFRTTFERTGSFREAMIAAGNPNLHVFPQQPRSGYQQFAVEVPSDERELTQGAKKALGILSGKLDLSRLNTQTFQSQVRFRPKVEQPEPDTRVYEIPDGLQNRVPRPSEVRDQAQALAQVDDAPVDPRQPIRKLTDLSFDMDAETSQAVTRSREAVDDVHTARRAGEIGEAEIAAIEADDGAAEAGQKAMEQERQALESMWERIQAGMQLEMDEGDRQILSVLQEDDPDPAAVEAFLREVPAREDGSLSQDAPMYEHPDFPGFRLVVDKKRQLTVGESGQRASTEEIEETLQVLREATGEGPRGVEDLTAEEFIEFAGGPQPDQRTVMSLRWIAPDGSEIRSRHISTQSREIEVPASLTDDTGNLRQPWRGRLFERIQNNEQLDDLLLEMQEEARDVQLIKLQGFDGEFEVLAEDGNILTLKSRSNGERFQVNLAEEAQDAGVDDPTALIQSSRSVEEANRPVSLPRRLTEDEVYAEAVRAVKDFGGDAAFYSTGEWRHQVPGVFASVRRSTTTGDYVARVFRENREVSTTRHKISELPVMQRFDSREAAEAWLSEQHGFRQVPTRFNAAERFRQLPDLADIDNQNIDKVEKELTEILKMIPAQRQRWIPSPLRQYATKFARLWTQKRGKTTVPGSQRIGPFTTQSRRDLNIYHASEYARQARYEPGNAPMRRPADIDIKAEGRVGEIVTGVDEAKTYPDVEVIDGYVLDASVNQADPKAHEMARHVRKQFEHNRRFWDADGQFRPDDISADNLVRYGPEDRLAVITDPKIGSPDVEIAVVEQGEYKQITVAKENATRVRSSSKAREFKRLVDDAMGNLRHVQRTADMGFGNIDQQFGLDGVTNRREFKDQFVQETQDILDRITVHGDGSIVADPEDQEVLTQAYIRLKELGIDTETIQNKETERLLFPEPLRSAVKEQAYMRIREDFSGVSAYGDLVARAKLGDLTSRETEILNKQVNKLGINAKRPDWEKVEEMVQRAWDPEIANRLFQLRNDMGFLRMANNDNLPRGAVTFRPPASPAEDVGAIKSWFSMPKTLARKHPTFGFFRDRMSKEITREGQMKLQLEHDLNKIRNEYTDDQIMQVRNLMERDELLGVMDHPSDTPTRAEIREAIPDEDIPDFSTWEDLFGQFRDIFERFREMQIKTSLREGIRVRELNLAEAVGGDDFDMQRLKKDFNLSDEQFNQVMNQVQDGESTGLITEPTIDPTNARPQQEIDAFWDILQQYASPEDIPDNIRADMKDWMLDEFTMWKNIGIRNYWPDVHQGKFIVEAVRPGEANQQVAWVQNGLEAKRLIQQLRSPDADVPGSEKFDFGPDTEFTWKIKGAYVDEVDSQTFSPYNYRKAYSRLAEKIEEEGGDPDAVGAIFQDLGIRTEPGPPPAPHTKRRHGGLLEVIDNPIDELRIYGSRVIRHRYLQRIGEASRMAIDMDEDLAGAYGVNPLKANTPLLKQFRLLRQSAMGERTWQDRFLDEIAERSAWLSGQVKALPQRVLDEDEEFRLLDFEEYRNGMYNRDFAGRQAAKSAVGIQALLRLGMNLSGAAVNSTQYIMYAVPEIVKHTDSVTKAGRIAMQGIKDVNTYWRQATRSELPMTHMNNPFKAETEAGQELVDFAHDVGIATMPAKGTIGSGRSILGDTSPTIRPDESFWETGIKKGEIMLMAPFQGAERFNRLSTAFAAKRLADDIGMSKGEAVELARDMIDATQFQYYEQELPALMRGPIARVLTQFKPFVSNALKFEKDLVINSVLESTGRKAGTGNLKALMTHFAIGTSLGGAAYWADVPLLNQPFSWLAEAAGLPGPRDMIAQAGYEQFIEDPEDVQNPLFRSENMVLFGIPGLLGTSISNRLGVGGQDLDPRRWQDLFLGPTGSVYWEVFKDIQQFAFATDQSTEATIGMAGAEIVRRLAGPAGKFGLAPALFSMLGTSAATAVTHNPYHEHLVNTEAGQTAMREIIPNWAEGIGATIEMFNGDNTLYKGNIVDKEIPPGPTMLHEAAARIANVSTTRDAKQRAFSSWLYNMDRRERAQKQEILAQGSTALRHYFLDGNRNWETYNEILQLLEDGARLELRDPPTYEDMLNRFERDQRPRLRRMLERLSISQRAQIQPVPEDNE